MSKAKVSIDFNKLKKMIASGGQKGIKRAAKRLLSDSKARVPDDTGRLKNSGAVEEGDMKASVKYTVPYALYQHENISLKHKKGEAKYLTNTLKSYKDEYKKIIKDEIARVL